ncbi:MAG: hypothetical protein AABX47_01510 [Nanoarchaeota archaeon]
MQKIILGGLAGSGIVATLIISGIGLYVTNVTKEIGMIAISGGVGIGILLGILGVIGVLKRVAG